MFKKILSPFDGYPTTRRKTDRQGQPYFTITPAYLTPFGAKCADFLTGASTIGLLAGSIWLLQGMGHFETWHLIAALGGPFLASPLLKTGWRSFLKTSDKITMTQDQLKTGGPLGGRCFDRKLPHKFALVLHDKTRREQEQYELQQRRDQLSGRVTRKTRYYAEAFHVSYEYLGQRNDLLTVFGHKDALAILARLKACDEVLDGMTNKTDGISLDPRDEWGLQPGDIE